MEEKPKQLELLEKAVSELNKKGGMLITVDENGIISISPTGIDKIDGRDLLCTAIADNEAFGSEETIEEPEPGPPTK